MADHFFKISENVKESLCKTFSILNIFLLILIGMYHIISTKQKYGFKCGQNYLHSLQLSFLLLLFGTLAVLGLVLQTFDNIKSNIFCEITQFGGVISHIMFKTVLYLLFVARLNECFGCSTLHIYKRSTLIIWSIILILWNIINALLIITTNNVYLDLNRTPFCVVIFTLPLTLPSVGLLDVIACIVNLYLFIRPIWSITKKQELAKIRANSSFIQDDAKQMKLIAIKQCILSSIATITTVLAIIFVVLFEMNAVFGSIDITLSFICSIMMFKWNSFCLEKLCQCCKKSNEKSGELEMNVKSSTTTGVTIQ